MRWQSYILSPYVFIKHYIWLVLLLLFGRAMHRSAEASCVYVCDLIRPPPDLPTKTLFADGLGYISVREVYIREIAKRANDKVNIIGRFQWVRLTSRAVHNERECFPQLVDILLNAS